MFYKIINDIVSIDFLHYLQPSSSMTRGHSQRFIPISTRVNTHFCHLLLKCGTPSLSKLFQLTMLITLSLNYAHAHIYTHS